MKKRPALYHYTVGPKLELIQGTGALMPAGFGLALSKREKPVLWWSANPQWEPTAGKVMSLDGGKTFFRPDLPELHARVGVYRFVLPEQEPTQGKLYPWPDIARVAHIDAREIPGMVKAGVQQGSRPVDWWGTLLPEPLRPTLRLDVWSQGTWVEVAGGLPDAIEQWRGQGVVVKQSTATETPGARGL